MPDLRPGSVPLPGSALFIDVPNVLNGYSRSNRINWRVLTSCVLQKELPGTKLVHAGSYARHAAENEGAGRWLDQALLCNVRPDRRGIVMRATRHDSKDVDSWIMSDIWMATVRYHVSEVLAYEVIDYPFKMKYILVSGDGGYLRAFNQLEGSFCELLRKRVVVYAWREHLSSTLLGVVGKNFVRYLDDIPGVLMDPPASLTLAAG